MDVRSFFDSMNMWVNVNVPCDCVWVGIFIVKVFGRIFPNPDCQDRLGYL